MRKPDENSRLPRTLLQGTAANYVAVDYELPRDPERDPHDLTTDPRGNAWIAERNGCCLAKFDPKTFTFTEIELPAGEIPIASFQRDRQRRRQSLGSGHRPQSALAQL